MTADFRLYRYPAAPSGQLIRPSPIDRATAILAHRRRRASMLGIHRELAGDTGWDVLLQLFIATARGDGMSIDELAGETETPSAVLSRWVAALRAKELVADPPSANGGDADIRLTASGSAIIDAYLEEV